MIKRVSSNSCVELQNQARGRVEGGLIHLLICLLSLVKWKHFLDPIFLYLHFQAGLFMCLDVPWVSLLPYMHGPNTKRVSERTHDHQSCAADLHDLPVCVVLATLFTNKIHEAFDFWQSRSFPRKVWTTWTEFASTWHSPKRRRTRSRPNKQQGNSRKLRMQKRPQGHQLCSNKDLAKISTSLEEGKNILSPSCAIQDSNLKDFCQRNPTQRKSSWCRVDAEKRKRAWRKAVQHFLRTEKAAASLVVITQD